MVPIKLKPPQSTDLNQRFRGRPAIAPLPVVQETVTPQAAISPQPVAAPKVATAPLMRAEKVEPQKSIEPRVRNRGQTTSATQPVVQAPTAPQAPAAPLPSTPESWSVDPKQTVQGLVTGIIGSDSPLMQQARTTALQSMNQRGLLNSTMAEQAGQAAVLNAALPIASQDASIYARAGEFNTGQKNQWGLADKNIAATTARDTVQQGYTRENMATQQGFDITKMNLDSANILSRMSVQQQNDLAKMAADQGYNLETLSAQQVNELAKLEATYSQQAERDAAAVAANKDAAAALAENGLKELAARVQADKTNLSNNFITGIQNTTATSVNQIMTDGKLAGAEQLAAVTKVIDYANTQIDWANTFYGTTVPGISAPISPSTSGLIAPTTTAGSNFSSLF